MAKLDMNETAARSEIDRIIASDPNGELDRDELLAWSSPRLLLTAIHEQAESLGIAESHLAWIAARSLLAPLPEGWIQYKDSHSRLYYHNHSSGMSRWDHPMDEHYRNLYKTYRSQSAAVHPKTQNQPDVLEQLDRALISASHEWKMQVVGILEAHRLFVNKDLGCRSAGLAKCEHALAAATRKVDEAETVRRALIEKLDQSLAAGERLEAECDEKTCKIEDLIARLESTLHDRDALRLALGEASERHRRDRLEFERVAGAERSQWADERQILERELMHIKEHAETVAMENSLLERRAKDCSELKRQLDSSKVFLHEATEITRDLEVDRANLNSVVATLRDHVHNLSQQLQVAHECSGKLETARANLDRDITVDLTQRNERHDILDETTSCSQRLEGESTNLHRDNAALRKQLGDVCDRLKEVEDSLRKLETERLKLDRDYSSLRKHLEESQHLSVDTTDSVSYRESERAKLYRDNNALRLQLDDVRQQLQEAEDRSRRLQTEHLQMDRDITVLRTQLKEARDRFDGTMESSRRQEDECLKLERDNAILRSSLADMRLQIQDIGGHSRKLDADRAKLDRDNGALRTKLEQAQGMISNTTEGLQRELENRAQVNRDNVTLREQLDAARQQLREADESMRQQGIKRASIEGENDVLQMQLREARDIITENARRQEDHCAKVDRDNASLSEQLTDMRIKFNALYEKSQSELEESGRQYACKVAQMREQWEKLDCHKPTLNEQVNDFRQNFNKFVENSRSELEESGRQHAYKVAEMRDECHTTRCSVLQSEKNSELCSDTVKWAQAQVRSFDEELCLLHETIKTDKKFLKRVEAELSAANSALAKQAKSIAAARSVEAAEVDHSIANVKLASASMSQVDEWRARYHEERGRRRELHDKLMELQGNIRVACRCRPPLPNESDDPNGACCVEFPIEGAISVKNDTGITQRYEFDHVLQPNSTQAEVYHVVEPYIQSALDGQSVCIFAYGQTGSGKSHTMLGSVHDRGVYYRAIMHILQHNAVSSCTLSVLEIYNETIQDLLAGDTGFSKLEIKGGRVPGLTEHPVESIDDVERHMTKGNNARTVGSHEINTHSSRSHLIIALNLRIACGVAKPLCSRLNLIDLAGSERLSRTKAVGNVAKEAAHINRSLSALGDVIHALRKPKPQHVPYRNSKLTHFLQESLSLSAKVLMLVNISPAQANASETICSLVFAARCREVKLGFICAAANAGQVSASAHENEDLLKAQKIIRSLQAKVSAAQSHCPNCSRRSRL